MIHRAIVLGVLGWCAIVATGCASRVAGFSDSNVEDSRPDGWVRTDGGDVPRDVRYRDVPIEYDVFREDACAPEAGMGIRMYDCDPFRPTATCPPGQACYPFIEYPEGRCGREVYRAVCLPAGTTPVDGFCTGGEACEPGSACFVTGAGNRCLRLCRLDGGEPRCPRGQVCEPTDLPDFGACD